MNDNQKIINGDRLLKNKKTFVGMSRTAVLSVSCTLLFYPVLPPCVQAQEQAAPNSLQVQFGVDSWSIRSSAMTNTEPGYVEEKTNLLLPDAYPVWNYRSISPFLRVFGEKPLGADLTLNVKAGVDQFLGVRVDGLNLDWMISSKLGIRTGIVEYKTNWCQTYEASSPWVKEINPLCATKPNLDVTGGAPGIQAYTNSQQGDYVLQTSFGVYDPLLFKYAPSEYGNVVLSTGFKVNSNKKWSATVNALNVQTGLEYRMSFLRAIQSASIPDVGISGVSMQTYDMVFAGVGYPLFKNLRLDFEGNERLQKINVASQFSDSYNFDSVTKSYSLTAAAIYQLNEANLLAVSFSANRGKIYDENIYNASSVLQEQISPALLWPANLIGIAWRLDFNEQSYLSLQFTHSVAATWTSSLASGLAQQSYPSSGSALGLRVGYLY